MIAALEPISVRRKRAVEYPQTHCDVESRSTETKLPKWSGYSGTRDALTAQKISVASHRPTRAKTNSKRSRARMRALLRLEPAMSVSERYSKGLLDDRQYGAIGNVNANVTEAPGPKVRQHLTGRR